MSTRDVARHYDRARPRPTRYDEIMRVRAYNNYVKAILINAAIRATECVRYLDLCCGNGGDIGKIARAAPPLPAYIGVDVAPAAVHRASDRLVASTLRGDVMCVDAFSASFGRAVCGLKPFGVVSCQFAIHYAFESMANASVALDTIAAAIRDGGQFVGTTVDAEYLNKSRALLGRRFGDSCHRVNFAANEPVEFGDAYDFTMPGSVDSLREYVVRRDTLVRMCAERGMRLVEWRNFQSFPHEDDEMRVRMGADDIPPSASRIYVAFRFQSDADTNTFKGPSLRT